MNTGAHNRSGRARTAALVAGGTGGHMFPAQALAEELARRGWRTVLMTEERGAAFATRFAGWEIHRVPAAPLSARAPWRLPGQVFTLVQGFAQARRLLARLEPSVVVGFGGYPSFAPLMAADRLGIALCIHEQNAVAGRANRVLARRAAMVALSFPRTRGFEGVSSGQMVLTGNPVRATVRRAAREYVPPTPADTLRVLVFGGSQGASVLARALPEALAMVSGPVRARLAVTLQCTCADMPTARMWAQKGGFAMRVAPFYRDLPEIMANAHLVVSRAGASTVSELAITGRPAILAPLMRRGGEQRVNAALFAATGAARALAPAEITPGRLAPVLEELLTSPRTLARMARAAAGLARPRAATALGNMIETAAANTGGGGSSPFRDAPRCLPAPPGLEKAA